MALAEVTDIDFEGLYRSHWHALVRLAALLVDDVGTAEDVVQDAFISAHRRQSAIRNPDAALGYLRTAIVNGARSTLRKRQSSRRRLELLSRRREQYGDSADTPLVVSAEYEPLIAALRQLPRRQREVLVLRYWNGLSEAEIALTLAVSVGTVKSTASRGLDTLEALIGAGR